MKLSTKVAGSLVLTKLAVHYGPSVASIWPIALRYSPALAGFGSPDSVALTFDDGPDPISTPLFLDELRRLGVPATFFLLGEMVDRYPYVARSIKDEGHDIALHGYYHRNHLRRSSRSIRYDFARGKAAIEDATGVTPAFVRPPYGVITRGTLNAAHTLGLRVVLWGTWGRDWRAAATPHSVLADVRSRLKPGVTILLHDSDCTSAPGAFHSSLGALPQIVALARQEHWSPSPLSTHGL